jgi:hypothetical protein
VFPGALVHAVHLRSQDDIEALAPEQGDAYLITIIPLSLAEHLAVQLHDDGAVLLALQGGSGYDMYAAHQIVSMHSAQSTVAQRDGSSTPHDLQRYKMCKW